MTSKYGEFSISLPGPGSYKVRVTVPYTAQLVEASDDDVHVRSSANKVDSTLEYEVTLEKSQCNYLELDIDGSDPRETATIAGNVLTLTGQGVDKGTVFLINDVASGQDYGTSLKKRWLIQV